MSCTTFDYQGAELELFAKATNWKRYLRSQLRPFIKGHVVEVGAGIGGTTKAMSSIDGIRSWMCIEPDVRLAQCLEHELSEVSALYPLCARSGTLFDLPPTDVFDTILYIDVLEHIEDDAAELQEAFNRLKPGGHIVVLCPAWQVLFSPFDEAVGHFRRHTKSSLRRLAPKGAAERAAFYSDIVGLLASLINLLALRQKTPNAAQIQMWDKLMVPVSRILDPITLRTLGKSVVLVWAKEGF